MYRKIALALFVLFFALPAPLLAQTPPAPRANGAVLFAADFGSSNDLEAAFDDEWMNFSVSGGAGTITSQAPGVVLTALVPGRTFGDFVAEVDLLPAIQPDDTQAGFLFRADAHPDIDVNAYNLFVDPSSDVVGLSTLVEGGLDEDKVDLGSALLSEIGFDAAASNRLRLEAVGSTLTVFLNGNFAFAAESSFVLNGGFGLALGTPDNLAAGATSSAGFAKLRVFAPGASQPAAAPAPAAPAAPAASAQVAAPATVSVPTAIGAPVAQRANGAVLFESAFNDPGDLEAVFSSDKMILDVHDGVATISSSKPRSLMGALLPGRIFDDFIVEVDINPQSIPASADFGLFLRSSDALYVADSLYYLGIDPGASSLFAIFYHADTADDMEELGEVSLDGLGYTSGVMNRLRVEAVGNSFVVFLNGNYALTIENSFAAQGTLGLAMGTGRDAGPNNKARADFDNLTVYAPGVAPAAAAPIADAPALEAEISGIFGMVSTKSLNVRSGPGATFPVVGKLAEGSMVLVDARNADCSWLQIMALEAEGWVSSQYVDLVMNSCDEVPLAGSAGAAQPAAPVAPVAAAISATGSTVSSVVTNFESFGTWKRGDEAYGTFTQSAEKVAGGAYAGKLTYDFPANAPDGKNYLVFKQEIPIAGAPSALTMEVYGDGSGSLLNVWVTDAGGQAWQFAFGPVTHTGWKTMTAPLDTTAKWPVGIVAGSQSDKKLDYPINLRALVLDYPTDDAHAGVIYVDNFTATAQ